MVFCIKTPFKFETKNLYYNSPRLSFNFFQQSHWSCILLKTRVNQKGYYTMVEFGYALDFILANCTTLLGYPTLNIFKSFKYSLSKFYLRYYVNFGFSKMKICCWILVCMSWNTQTLITCQALNTNFKSSTSIPQNYTHTLTFKALLVAWWKSLILWCVINN